MSRTRISHDEAFAEYVALGAVRSLAALGCKLGERGVAPSVTTLETWSARHSWVARAREHDGQVAEQTRARILQNEVHKRVALADAFSNLAKQAVDTTLKALKKQGTNLVAKAGDVEILVRAAAEAASRAEVL